MRTALALGHGFVSCWRLSASAAPGPRATPAVFVRSAGNRRLKGYRTRRFTKQVDLPTARTQPGPSILVAEDNPDTRDALRALLEAYGFSVLEAENGQDAVDKALRYRPDLVLMDIMMPVMDGLQATRALRASPHFRQVPIIALTAMSGARQLALDAGCDRHLPKPIDIPVFLDTIRDLLGENGTNPSKG